MTSAAQISEHAMFLEALAVTFEEHADFDKARSIRELSRDFQCAAFLMTTKRVNIDLNENDVRDFWKIIETASKPWIMGSKVLRAIDGYFPPLTPPSLKKHI